MQPPLSPLLSPPQSKTKRPEPNLTKIIWRSFGCCHSDVPKAIPDPPSSKTAADNPKVSLADIRALDQWRDIVPEYVKDYVPLNAFAA